MADDLQNYKLQLQQVSAYLMFWCDGVTLGLTHLFI